VAAGEADDTSESDLSTVALGGAALLSAVALGSTVLPVLAVGAVGTALLTEAADAGKEEDGEDVKSAPAAASAPTAKEAGATGAAEETKGWWRKLRKRRGKASE